MAKIAIADVLHKAVDTAIQLNGARGYSKDTVLEWIYRYARQARLVDGASAGSGRTVDAGLLPVGAHVIGVRATDSSGDTALASIGRSETGRTR